MPAEPVTDGRRDLLVLLRSRVPLVLIETRDEPRVLETLSSLALELSRPLHTPVFKWTLTDGLVRLDIDLGAAQRHNAEPEEVLRHIRAVDKAGVYVLLDFYPFVHEPVHVRLLKDICLGHARVPRTLVLVSHELKLPAELEHLAARFALHYPDRDERRAVVEKVAREWQQTQGSRVRSDPKALDLLLENLAGLSVADTERLARGAIFNDGALTAHDLPRAMQAKYELLNRHGVLRYECDTADFAAVGGMRHLKRWLQQRRPAFAGELRLEPPKGALLLGVQGCGKSLCARAAAGLLGVPLLRFDPAALYNKYTGESERNLRETLHTAERTVPAD